MHSAASRPILAVLVLAALALLAAAVAMTSSASSAPAPEFDPDNFVREVDNPFFPLEPGTTYFYEGSTEGVPNNNTTEVTHQTKVILGITATVVHDLAYEEGVLVEETFDWYAQDKLGNVWYLGEDSRELDEFGNVISTEGSWEAGVDGAQPGIIMLADPKKGDRYSQEVAPGVAEDMAQVVGVDESACLSSGECFDGVLVTKEWTPLERGVTENKYYAEGIGLVLTVMTKGGAETSELVSVTGPGGSIDD